MGGGAGDASPGSHHSSAALSMPPRVMTETCAMSIHGGMPRLAAGTRALVDFGPRTSAHRITRT